MKYNELSKEWKMCFELAVKAFKHGSLPIGCIIFDAKGGIVSKASAAMVYGGKKSNMTQHAEIIALSKIPVTAIEQKLILYSTVEPCPMCFGATNVARISELYYGTRDPWAGSTDLVNGNWYMKRKQIDIHKADDTFEYIMACFLIYGMMRKKNGKFCSVDSEFINRWGTVFPNIKNVYNKMIGINLFKKNTEQIYNTLLEVTKE